VDPRRTPAAGRAIFTLAALIVFFFFSWLGLQPPAPRAGEVPANQFSGTRARAILQQLVGNGAPHPTGSTANDVVREHIMALLTQYGYAPEIHPGFSCDEYGSCAYVNNIVARIDGREPDDAVVLACHYDSVAAGPGATDDGAGVAAVLEIARALKQQPQPLHSIILLVDDGEEAGLLGARVFTDQDSWEKNVRAAVNLDARGTSGVSWMYETGTANEWIVGLLARTVPRPSANSVTYTVYKLMPNDTDFTVFKSAGIQGANFANIAEVVHYHTPLDNFDNSDPRTLEDDGMNAFPLVLALANGNLQSVAVSEAVYFELFGRRVARWPARLAPLVAWITLILIGFESAWLLRVKAMSAANFGWALLIWPLTVLVTGILGEIIRDILRVSGPLPVLWVAYPLPAKIAFGALGVAVAIITALALGHRTGFCGAWAGIWIWWAVIGVLVASVSPGLSYVFSVPCVAAALTGILHAWRHDEPGWAASLSAIAPVLSAALVGLPLVLVLYTALGTVALAGLAILVALIMTTMAPLFAAIEEPAGLLRLSLRGIPVGVMLLALLAAYIVPVFSAQAPERLNYKYWLDADSGKAEWVVEPDSGKIPDAIRLAANFQRKPRDVFPWSAAASYQTPAPKLDLAAPTFTILQSSVTGDTHYYTALLRSERGAPASSVLFPPAAGINSVRIEGLPVEPETPAVRKYFNGWWLYDCVTMPAQGVEIAFRLPVGKPVEVWVADRSYGLPAEGAFLLKARPLAATPSDEGDLTVITRRVELLP